MVSLLYVGLIVFLSFFLYILSIAAHTHTHLHFKQTLLRHISILENLVVHTHSKKAIKISWLQENLLFVVSLVE